MNINFHISMVEGNNILLYPTFEQFGLLLRQVQKCSYLRQETQ